MFKNFHNSLNSLTSISIQFTTASHTYILTHGIAKAFLSVCLFNQRCALWQNERNLYSYSYNTWKQVHSSIPTRRMVGGGRLPCTWNFGPHWPVRTKTRIFNRYSLVAPQP